MVISDYFVGKITKPFLETIVGIMYAARRVFEMDRQIENPATCELWSV